MLAEQRQTALLFYVAGLIRDLILNVRWFEQVLQERVGRFVPLGVLDRIDDTAILAADCYNIIINLALQNVEWDDIGPPPIE